MANESNLSAETSNSDVSSDEFSHYEALRDEIISVKEKSKKTGPKRHQMDLASAASRAKSRKCYHQRMQNETEEERQERLASRKKYMKEYYKNLKPEEKERRLQRNREMKKNSDFYKKFYQKLVMTETEAERTRRIEYKKIHQKKKMMLMTEEERMKKKQRISEYMKLKLWEETEEERKARLEYKKEVNRKFKERETPEEREERLKLTNERMRKRMLNETPEQRKRRLERQRIQNHKRSQEMTPEELEERRQRDRERRKNLTEEQRVKKREQNRLSSFILRKNETLEQRARRLGNYHRYISRKNMQMTEAEREAEREARREQERERVAKKRMQETEEEREKRLENYRRYNKRRPSRRKSNSSGECTAIGTPQPDGSQGDAEISETATKRPGRSAKSKAGSNIRQQLEHETPGAVLAVSVTAYEHPSQVQKEVKNIDKLKMRAVVLLERIGEVDRHGKFSVQQKCEESMKTGKTVKRKRDRIQCDENCNNPLVKSSNNENDSSMKLIEKWCLRPLMIRLERLDVAETIRKVKDLDKSFD